MRRETSGPVLSAVFVDYDNIYLSLKRKSEEAAKRFAKDAALWLREIDSGRLITPTNGSFGDIKRRLVMNRCYGNPVPRRNTNDNSTDMNSFPFVRHHFLRAGFEIADCPPLTAQLKNSSDIRMVMDVRDFLTHDTYFDEFVIMSGDADFTPVLHRLRAHARRTVIFANDYTAAPYTAICDGEIRESDLIRLLLDGQLGDETARPSAQLPSSAELEQTRLEIIAEVAQLVRQSSTPVPLEVLAERAVRALGHERTVALGWAGAGSFRELLAKGLPNDIRMSDDAPYVVYRLQGDPRPALEAPAVQPPRVEQPVAARSAALDTAVNGVGRSAPPVVATEPPAPVPALPSQPRMQPAAPAVAQPRPRAPMLDTQPAPRSEPAPMPATIRREQPPAPSQAAAQLQQSIARIRDACQAPALSPPDYAALFELMAREITERGLQGVQTLANIEARANERGVQLKRDDVRFVLDVVGEADPWFEQGASANLFASRFRNFVVARCRSQGLSLSADEIDLIEAWFAGGAPPPSIAPSRPQPQQQRVAPPAPAPQPVPEPVAMMAAPAPARADSWWNAEPAGQVMASASTARMQPALSSEPPALSMGSADQDEFPRIVRSRLRG